MKVRARLVVVAFSLLGGIWAVDCGGGDEPTKVPIYTAGNGGTQSGAAGEQGGAGTTGQAGGAGSAEGGTTGEAGRDASGSGEAGKGEAGSGAAGAAGSRGTGEAGAMGAAGRGAAGAAGTTGAAGTGNPGSAGSSTTGAAGGGAAGAGGTTGAAGSGGGATRAEVQDILNSNCIVCHGTSGGMSLADVSRIVGVASSECGAKMRVSAGAPMSSYIIDKLMGASQAAGGCFSGMRMPRGRAALSAANIATIASWIRAGAN
jgi:hypothetical protein